MKETMRIGVWETNSSSVHSISVSSEGMVPCDMEPEDDGYIHVSGQEFGTELKYYNSQRDKLSYLLTCCCYMSGCEYSYDYEKLYESYYFRCVEDAVLNYLKKDGRDDVVGIRFDNMEEAMIDHQSIPEYGDFPVNVNVYNEEDIQNFIFNKYISLKTDRD